MKPTFSADILEGKLVINSRGTFDRYLRNMGNTHAIVTIEKDTKNRTKSQNRLYWMYLTLISASTGHEPEELHMYFKRKFLPVVEMDIMGERIKKVISTRELDIFDFKEYLDKIEQKTEVPIPDTTLFEKAILK